MECGVITEITPSGGAHSTQRATVLQGLAFGNERVPSAVLAVPDWLHYTLNPHLLPAGRI